TAALVILVGAGWLLLETGVMRRELAALRRESSIRQREIERQSVELRQLAGQQPSTQVLTFLLSPGLTRSSDEVKRLRIPSAAESAEFQLEVRRPMSNSPCRASIRTFEGVEIWSQSGVSQVLRLPTRVLVPADYELALQCRTPPGDFQDSGD